MGWEVKIDQQPDFVFLAFKEGGYDTVTYTPGSWFQTESRLIFTPFKGRQRFWKTNDIGTWAAQLNLLWEKRGLLVQPAIAPFRAFVGKIRDRLLEGKVTVSWEYGTCWVLVEVGGKEFKLRRYADDVEIYYEAMSARVHDDELLKLLTDTVNAEFARAVGGGQ